MNLFTIIFGLHLFFLVSVFDIYFNPPVFEKPIKPIKNDMITKTKRLVLFVGDGLPADHLFDVSSGYSKTPFLRSVIENNGAWGVSHTQVPTESRHGHIALIAGFYEYPLAVFRGWMESIALLSHKGVPRKSPPGNIGFFVNFYEDPLIIFRGWMENAVHFDSVFNQSMITFSWGSPNILPIFSKGPETEHVHYFSYSPEMIDISGRNNTGSQLNTWVLNQFKQFINYNLNYYKIHEKSKVVFFFHLSGTDVAGHANKPHSLEYNITIKNMDMVIHELYLSIEKLFVDKHTTYLFTSDHGMSAWGSHGAGYKIESETPIIVWGAGIKKSTMSSDKSRGLTPDNWKLAHLFRHDINQVDIAVLMSVLLGIPIPVHSVGVLPLNFLDFSNIDRAKAYVLNARQLITQLRAKEYNVKSQLADCLFRPYSDISYNNYEEVLLNIEKSINSYDYTAAENLTHHLIVSTLAGLEYYDTYFQNILLTCTLLSYLSLGAILIAEIMRCNFIYRALESERSLYGVKKLILKTLYLFLLAFILILGFVNALPQRYIIYLLIPLSLWYHTILKYSWILKYLDLFNRSVICNLILYTIGLQLIVLSFNQKWILSLMLCAFCSWPGFGIFSVMDHQCAIAPKRYRLLWSLTCIGLSIFPLLSIVGGKEEVFIKILTGCAWIVAQYILLKSSTFKNLGLRFNLFLKIQIFLTPLLLWNIYTIAKSFNNGEGLHLVNQCLSYGLFFVFLGLMYYGPKTVISQFNTLSCSVGLTFLMFSSSYEAIFPLLLAVNLFCWILFERMVDIRYSTWPTSILVHDGLGLYNHDFRRSFFFVFYIMLSFFGIGNIASINTFDMAWVRAFVTSFSPTLIISLMIVKILLPLILVTSAFRSVSYITSANSKLLFLTAILICDSMAVQFLLNVKNKGSCLKFGISLSHLIIIQSIVIFLFIVYRITKYITPITVMSCLDCDNILRKWHDA